MRWASTKVSACDQRSSYYTSQESPFKVGGKNVCEQARETVITHRRTKRSLKFFSIRLHECVWVRSREKVWKESRSLLAVKEEGNRLWTLFEKNKTKFVNKNQWRPFVSATAAKAFVPTETCELHSGLGSDPFFFTSLRAEKGQIIAAAKPFGAIQRVKSRAESTNGTLSRVQWTCWESRCFVFLASARVQTQLPLNNEGGRGGQTSSPLLLGRTRRKTGVSIGLSVSRGDNYYTWAEET